MIKQIASMLIPLLTFGLAPVVLVAPPAPIISDLTVAPSSGPSGTVYRISLRIAGSAVVVPILKQVREGKEAISVPLRDDGREGDDAGGDGIYTGHSGVPPKAAKQTHRFEVFVQDLEGRKSNLLVYLFTVVDEDRKAL